MLIEQSGSIDTLKVENEFVAREIVKLQREAYRIEAKIIGSIKIPPMYDTVDCIKICDETFIGYRVQRQLLGLISYKCEYGILDIHRLVVKPAHFKKGIATQLIQHVLKENKDAQKIIVATGAKNTPAIKLYKNNGFKIIREFEVEMGLRISQLEYDSDLRRKKKIDGLEIRTDIVDGSQVPLKTVQRDEAEMMNTIETFIKQDDLVRAAVMNGSRVNPNVKPDSFQDYDIVCFTADPMIYVKDQSWIEKLGSPLIIQQNDVEVEDTIYPIFLMQFSDGNRIDMQFFPVSKIDKRDEDSLEKLIIDKDGLLGSLAEPTDKMYHTQKPSEKEFLDKINNIFWCSVNVVKGIHRQEFNYVKRMQEQIIRADLNTVMRWYIASKKDWSINTGVFGKWMQAHLTKDQWADYLQTCPGDSYYDMWQAMIKMIDITSEYGKDLAQKLGVSYPQGDEAGIRAYIAMCPYDDAN
ncbi:GNAT family N-acetyltransferase [Fusibacter sp. JL216-2]|uniref:GNAT family N-acetyltransferase n=1 Tax=Fusibacter sp. JL216-2 TaxID=3071453 RepID=UPI003D343CC9